MTYIQELTSTEYLCCTFLHLLVRHKELYYFIFDNPVLNKNYLECLPDYKDKCKIKKWQVKNNWFLIFPTLLAQ